MKIKILSFIFLIIGIISLIDPDTITLDKTKESYDLNSLIRGWAIYSITIGGLLLFPNKYRVTLLWCFISSIILRLLLIMNKSMTNHHITSIVANLIGIILLF